MQIAGRACLLTVRCIPPPIHNPPVIRLRLETTLLPLYLWKNKAAIPTVIIASGLIGWFLFRL